MQPTALATETSEIAASSLPACRGVLLTMGDYLGTLAAARDLGRHGIPVVLADSRATTLTSQSCYVSRRERCPDVAKPREWLDWLLDFGRREPGHVLLATSDDVCWIMDAHREELAKWFRLFSPPRGGLYPLLNKRSLYELCREIGIDQPEQWTPQEALADSQQLPYPVIVKPRTQAGLRLNPKGSVVASPASLASTLDSFRDRYAWHDEMLAHDPHVADLMVQAFHGEGEQQIYSLAGFYAPGCGTFLVRASQKVLQHPLRIGVGLCFESREVHPRLASQLRLLMDRAGYQGAFEVEYIHLAGSDRYLLIDFNPRFYGQMAFEISRGLPIPRLCHLAACGDWDGVRQLALLSQMAQGGPARFRNAWMLRLYVTTHMLGGNMSRSQWRYWLDWARENGSEDPVFTQDDPVPAASMRWQVKQSFVRTPRSTLRKFFVR